MYCQQNVIEDYFFQHLYQKNQKHMLKIVCTPEFVRPEFIPFNYY